MSFSTHELLPACQVLFGPEHGLGHGFLESLHEDLVKTVFRRRAFETHPDRAHSAGLDPLDMTRRFQEVHAAKELLYRYLASRAEAPLLAANRHGAARPAAASPAPTARGGRRARAKTPPKHRQPQPGDYFWGGRVPDRQLPIGEYLYYCGRISLQDLIAAIHAQRTQRPIFGQLAEQRGFLRPAALTALLRQKRPGERLGDAALRLGLLTPYQRDVILGAQRALQRPFGRHFTDAGLLSVLELTEAVRAQRHHNFGRTARRAS